MQRVEEGVGQCLPPPSINEALGMYLRYCQDKVCDGRCMRELVCRYDTTSGVICRSINL